MTGSGQVVTNGSFVAASGSVSGAATVATLYARPGQSTYANLAATDPSPQVGDLIDVTDASACTANAAVSAGGGTTHSCPTVWNGVNYVAMVTH